MNITFGWGYDGARWTTPDSPATVGSVVVGPTRLIDLLSTRLACTAPEADQPLRIAAVRAALSSLVPARADDDPFARSFRADPWSLSRTVLAWRDELVAAGWDGVKARDASPRIALIAEVDALARVHPEWMPGAADLTGQVAATLTDLASSGATWPVGIGTLTVDNAFADLPPIWRSILDNLAALGVQVVEAAAPGPVQDLRIVTTDTEWDAASTTVRLLADTLLTHQEPVSVVASSATDVLDRELARRGLPQVGVRDRSTERAFAQIVPVFLAAVSSPPDVHAIGTLLEHTVTTTRTDDGTLVPVRLVPAKLRTELIRALSNQPGVGGPLWNDAITTTIAHYEGKDEPEAHKASLARDLDQLIRVDPLTEQDDSDAPGYDTARVADHLEWLADRLTTLAGNTDQDLKGMAQGTKAAAGIIAGLDGTTVSSHELTSITTDCTASAATSATSGSGAAASERQDVVASPSALGVGTSPVLWWLPVDDQSAPPQTFRPTEIAALRDAGIELPDREALSSLVLDSHLRAIRRRRSVTAVLPAEVNGETAAPHPVLTFLTNDVQGKDAAADGVDVPAAELIPASTHTPAPTDPLRPDPVERSIDPGEHLVPDYLSYSQWTSLLAHPLEWVLERQLGIAAAGLTSLPDGNQMIGTYLHAVVESIVERHLTDQDDPGTVTPTEDEVRRELEELMPQYASELLLPGHGRERGTVLVTGLASIMGLFTTLNATGIRISGAEAKYRTAIPNSRGAGGQPVQLGGYRDLDVILADGRDGVIDLKYTNSKKKYRELVEEGAALQLAVYAYSVAEDTTKLTNTPVAYYMLKHDRMDTSFPDFGSPEILEVSPGDIGSRTADDLWFRAVSGINRIFDDLRDGRIADVGNILAQGSWDELAKELRKEAKKKSPAPDDRISESPYSPEQVARYNDLIDIAVHRDFLPTDITKYHSFGLLTGLTGDYLDQ
ncbi:Hypothetical protein CGLY_11300 [Corynebacterium glyciniphilum AJ 3170]|uniref:PD-(D/E)XK endonuclease-like domain-containing protein n=1 Tax=Corynebacterium glyciniphilum AJ 3170 TaxID=1404245 RepID=X5EBE0_9CORY|nr:PD-(D/E)XK nuclease family protein [Corynebacterium glyciniphilum]AHW64705.1 Hypothetical protein CGLY_11300 [Corynebacterium glyciniphilum AJ 3170]